MEGKHHHNLTTPTLIGTRLHLKIVSIFPSTAAVGIKGLMDQSLIQVLTRDHQATIISMILQDTTEITVMLAVYTFKLPENVAIIIIIETALAIIIMAVLKMVCTHAILWITVEFSNVLILH